MEIARAKKKKVLSKVLIQIKSQTNLTLPPTLR